jgi:hypothetical protein
MNKYCIKEEGREKKDHMISKIKCLFCDIRLNINLICLDLEININFDGFELVFVL